MFYTYLHIRNDSNKVFYIGKGKDKRAYMTKRGKHWKNVVNKVEYTVLILSYWETEQEAFDHETLLIECFKEMGHPLVNQTNGGEGTSGLIPWNKGKKGVSIGNIKGSKRPGIGGVKKGTTPWNKGLTGYTSPKKGKKYPNSHSIEARMKKRGVKKNPLSIYKGLVTRCGKEYANQWLIKRGIQLPDEFR